MTMMSAATLVAVVIPVCLAIVVFALNHKP